MLINCNDTLTARFRKAQLEDTDVAKIIEIAKQGTADSYSMRSDLLFKEIDGQLKLVVPKLMQSQIVRHAHERPFFSGENRGITEAGV